MGKRRPANSVLPALASCDGALGDEVTFVDETEAWLPRRGKIKRRADGVRV